MSLLSHGGGFFLTSSATQPNSLDIGVTLLPVANLFQNFKRAEQVRIINKRHITDLQWVRDPPVHNY
jgi:hypothetical protein